MQIVHTITRLIGALDSSHRRTNGLHLESIILNMLKEFFEKPTDFTIFACGAVLACFSQKFKEHPTLCCPGMCLVFRIWIGYSFDSLELALIWKTGIIQFSSDARTLLFFVWIAFCVSFIVSITFINMCCCRNELKTVYRLWILAIFKVTSCCNALFIFTETYTRRDSGEISLPLQIIILLISVCDIVLGLAGFIQTARLCHKRNHNVKPQPPLPQLE